jgi:uncharacterized membrane protein
MGMLILGLVIFLGVHSTRVFADGWRTAMVAKMGALPWKAIYSVVSIAAFVLIVYGYGQARQQPVVLWTPPNGMRHLTALLMLPVFVLFVATYVPRNHFKAKLHHPQVLSVKLWALAHLVSNGTLADVLLFGGFLVWAVLSFRAARQRDRAASPSPQPSPQGGEGATAVGTAICVAVGLAVYVAFVFGLHAWLIGVRPV